MVTTMMTALRTDRAFALPRAFGLLLTLLSLSACEVADRDGERAQAFAEPAPLARNTEPQTIAAGAALFQEHCARCHGADAQGATDWRKAGADGHFPPPPLNGTGHAWHHPSEVLMEVIMDGSLGGGNMPAWRGKLTDTEVKAIIAWFQSLWSDDVYAVWSDLERRYRDETL